jgi:hypothetical protein
MDTACPGALFCPLPSCILSCCSVLYFPHHTCYGTWCSRHILKYSVLLFLSPKALTPLQTPQCGYRLCCLPFPPPHPHPRPFPPPFPALSERPVLTLMSSWLPP